MYKVFVCVTIFIFSMITTVCTHNGDIFSGSYVLDMQKRLKFKISKSAQTELMNSEVYNSARNWKDISSNIDITIIMETSGMPTIADCMGVYDGTGGSSDPDIFEDSDLGVTQYFDSKGNRVAHTSEKIYFVKILINTKTPRYDQYYSTVSDKINAASMNFMHEVGHALMLAHPTKNSMLSRSYNKWYALRNNESGASEYSKSSSGISRTNKP